MYEKLSAKAVIVTKKLAEEFRDMTEVPGERALKEHRLQVYRNMFLENTFRPCTWASAYCEETETTYRVNGHHTSVLLVELVDKLEYKYQVYVERYSCPTMADVSELYATFDSKDGVRSSGDINWQYAQSIPALKGTVVARTVDKVASGMAYHLWKAASYNMNPADRAGLLAEHTDFVLWYDALLKSDKDDPTRGTHKHIDKVPVVAGIFGSYQKCQSRALEFWKLVRDGTVNRPHPARVLYDFLKDNSVNNGNGARKVNRATTKEFYIQCQRSWNAFREGRLLKQRGGGKAIANENIGIFK